MSWNPSEWWSGSRTFLQEVRGEMKKVSWPSWDEVSGTTIVVVITSIIFGIFLYAVDFVFYQAVQYIYEAFGI